MEKEKIEEEKEYKKRKNFEISDKIEEELAKIKQL